MVSSDACARPLVHTRGKPLAFRFAASYSPGLRFFTSVFGVRFRKMRVDSSTSSPKRFRAREAVMKIVPLADKVVVKRTEPEETTAGGIVLPDAARERPAEGRVVSIGPGRTAKDGRLVQLQVSEGDRVLFSRHAGMEVEVDGDEFLILNEGDILTVFS